MRYDPEQQPDPRWWLQLQPEQRMRLARHAHVLEHGELLVPKEKLEGHALMHVTLEDEVATQSPHETGELVSGLVSHGWTRHQSLHSIGCLVAVRLLCESSPCPNPAYISRLQYLLLLLYYKGLSAYVDAIRYFSGEQVSPAQSFPWFWGTPNLGQN